MASNEEWCEQQMAKLSNEESRIEALQEIKTYLTTIPRDEISRAATSLRLPAVFDCLEDSNNEQVDLACDVLAVCLSNLQLGESTNKYGGFLEKSLGHESSAVKAMSLTEIKRNMENDDVLVDLCKRESLLISVIKCLGDSDLGVATAAADIIKCVGLSVVGIKQLVACSILKSLHEIMEVNETVRFRVYELLITISIESDTNFDVLKSAGLVPQILNELNNDDVLLRLNVLELLSQLATSGHGFDYLEENGTLKKLSLMLESDDIVTVQLCEPGILKFFGNLAYQKPMEILGKHPSLFGRMFTNLESTDFTVVGVSIETLGHIGVTNDGKVALDSMGVVMDNAVRTIAKTLPSMPTDIKVRGLQCLESLLSMVESNNQIASITNKWYDLIDDNPTEFVWNYAKNPFAELRLGGFGVLRAIVGQDWGQEAIRNTPGLLEFLTDRSVETMKECKETKFEIVEVLARSDVFDHATRKKLQVFVEEGPFYVHAVTEVAIEGNE